jgi:hypothetical protein
MFVSCVFRSLVQRSPTGRDGKVKGEVLPITCHEGPEVGEQMHSSTLPSTSTLDEGVGGQHHAPAALPRGKSRYPLFKRLGWLQGRSGRVRKISSPHRDSISGPSSPWRVAIPTDVCVCVCLILCDMEI